MKKYTIMTKYVILLLVLSTSLFAKNSNKLNISFSMNTISINDSNNGYFSKQSLATEFSVEFLYEVIDNLYLGLNFENLLDEVNSDRTDSNQFDYLSTNLTLNYSQKLFKELDALISLRSGYQKSFFILSKKEFSSNNFIVTPSLGLKYTLKLKENSFSFTYELGYRYQSSSDLKFKVESRDINYGTFSASGIKQKFKISVLF